MTTNAPRYLPFESGPHRLQMGLASLDPAQWIELDDGLAAELARKERLLAARPGEVFAALPGTEDSGTEVLAMLADHLTRRFPALYARDGAAVVSAPLGRSWTLADPALHPLDLAARMVPEDLCLMREGPGGLGGPGGYVLAAASLASPSRWRLADKLGRDLAAIHAPVPGYAARLGRAVDRFFAALAPQRPVWRLNWTVHRSPEPFQPGSAADEPRAPPAPPYGRSLFLRVERQTLRRLPVCRDVLFTIRTYIRPLEDVATDPDAALRLAAAVEGLPPEMREYRGLTAFADDLAAWLRVRAAAR